MEQTTIDPVGDEITAAAMADILAALDSAASIEAPDADETIGAQPEAQLDEPFEDAPVAGATPDTLGEATPAVAPDSVGHGRIRLRIRRVAAQEAADQTTAEPVVVREIVGHGTVRLRERDGEPAGVNVDVDIFDRRLTSDVIGDAEAGLREPSDDEPVVLDLTEAARAEIMEAIAATS
ncbi:MAG TPA: hypothetical protein VHZ75_10705 [Solirubrobacteraceae bacterium]|jgi:hypothetical protein|nr:hypothetical protein [Solirubrobacteraceae bacterium]